MPLPRHASRRRVQRLRAFLRGGVVGLLALPSVLGVTSVLGLTLTALVPHRAVAAKPTLANVAAAPRAAVRVGRPARPAPSPQESSAGEPDAPAPAVSVVGLGDSVPAGSGCACSAYVSLLAQSLGRRQGATGESTNLAVPGQTSQGLLDQLGSAHVRSAVADADVVVLTIGANDVEDTDPTTCSSSEGDNSDLLVASCYASQLGTLSGNLDRALQQLTSLASNPGAHVLVTGYWNVFLDGAAGKAKGATYMRLADAATRAVNARIATAAATYGATYVDLFTPFRGSAGTRDCTALLASDGDHPDADGHQLIAGTLAAAL